MTNPRDVTLDLVGKDQTGKATRSAADNLDKLAHKAHDVDDANKNLGSRAGRHLRKLSDALRGVASKMDSLKRKTEDGTLAVRSMGSKTAGSLRKLSRGLDDAKDDADRLNRVKLGKLQRELDDAGDEADRLKRKVDNVGNAGKSMENRIRAALRGMGKALGATAHNIRSVWEVLIIPAIVAAIALLPQAAAVAGIGIVAGLGGGLAALGIKFAATNEKVRKSFTDLKTHVVKKMDEISAAFVPVLQNISTDLQGAFDKIAPDLKKAFDRIAPIVRRFSKSVTESLDYLRPALDPVVEAFETLADSVSAGMPSLMQDIATAFTDIADALKDNPQSITDTITGLGHLIKTSGKVISWLIRMQAQIDLSDASFYSMMDHATAYMGRIAAGAADMVADILEALARIPGPGQAAFRLLAAAARAESDAIQRHLDKVNTRKARTDVANMEARLRVLGNMKPSPKVTAEIRDLKIKLDTAKALLAKLDGKTATVTVKYRSQGYGKATRGADGRVIAPNLSAVGFARTSPGGTHRTGGAAQIAAPSVTTYVQLDGREIAAHVRTIISEATGRQAFRARSGRR